MIVWLSGGRGRPAAIAVAVLLSLFQLSLGGSALEPLRNLLFDAYQRLSPRRIENYPVVLVDIDDASLAAYGQWPWPRARLASLIAATVRLGPLAVGLDFIMPEADRLSPNLILADRQGLTAATRQELARLPSDDALLAQALRQAPAVVARAGIIGGDVKAARKSAQTPAVIAGDSPLRYLQSYRGDLTNIAEIEAAASGWGNDAPVETVEPAIAGPTVSPGAGFPHFHRPDNGPAIARRRHGDRSKNQTINP